MNDGEGDKERTGAVLRIVALAAALIALAVIVAPRLASSGGGSASTTTSAVTASTTAPAAASLPMAGSSTTATTAAAATTVTAGATTTSIASEPNTTTTGAAPEPPADGGAIRLSLVGTFAGSDGAEQSAFADGETIGWRFRVTNSGDEYLWGVYVYLESYGKVACDDRRLEVGASTDCRAETTAWAGVNEATAWVTAWTSRRMLFEDLSYRYVVDPG